MGNVKQVRNLTKEEFFEYLHEVDKEVADAYAAVAEDAYGEYNIERIEKSVKDFRTGWDANKPRQVEDVKND